MNLAKTFVRSVFKSIPRLRFEDQHLSSFSGSVIYERLFKILGLRTSLANCVRHLPDSSAYGGSRILLLLIVHMLLGWRRLRDVEYYSDDPIVKRVLGLKKIPDFSTLSRRLRDFDLTTVDKVRGLCRTMVMNRVLSSGIKRLTIDFDGTVESTKSRQTVGTALGYNKKSKGSRSYYPLMATVAQTSQVFDVLHRAGNVHDSNGAAEFIEHCFAEVRESCFNGTIEARLDSAHYSIDTCEKLDASGAEFSISVPFHRLADLKSKVESTKRWSSIDDTWSYRDLGCSWWPASWSTAFRCIVFRQLRPEPLKGEIQHDLFEPTDWKYDYKVVVTNKITSAKNVLEFHNGRGSQEAIFAELKSNNAFGVIATRGLVANQIYRLSAIIAHNLNRELQMRILPQERSILPKRPALWIFENLRTFRHRLIQRAGRLTHPKGVATLTMSANKKVANELTSMMEILDQAA